MNDFARRTFIRGLGATLMLGPAAFRARAVRAADGVDHPDLVKINPAHLVSTDEARAWHVAKDAHGGPTFSGSPSWRHFVELVEKELRAAGVVDIHRNGWTYDRWFTTDWPHDANWALDLGGRKVRVASYGAYSGMTSDAGVTAPLTVYREGMTPAEVRGKILLVPAGAVGPGADTIGPLLERSLTADYEYLSDPTTFADPLRPRGGAQNSAFGKMSVEGFLPLIREGRAAGMLFVIDLPYDVLAGTYNFRVPARYDVPTLLLDQAAGAEALAAAGSQASATLRLIAQTEKAETWQLFGYLPGRNYGTEADEQIMLITHTDGPSISQDNGALGILGMVRYFSKIPREQRPRSLMIFLDNRHYMPGGETAFEKQDYAASHPEVYQRVIAAMGIEHLGQLELAEAPGRELRFTSPVQLSSLWTSDNQRLVDLAIKAVQDNYLSRVAVQAPGRPGAHGGQQGALFGLGRIAALLGVPGTSTMGLMTGYWSTRARLEALDVNHFVRQVATMSQIAGELMRVDIASIRPRAIKPA